MSKCRMIDRIAYTKGKIKFLDDKPEKQPEIERRTGFQKFEI